MVMENELDLMLESDDTLTEALAQEKGALLELALTQDEKAPKPPIAPHKKMLNRELAREALTRMEDAARTQSDFEAVIKIWDKLDQNEIRRVSNHEIGRSDIPLE